MLEEKLEREEDD